VALDGKEIELGVRFSSQPKGDLAKKRGNKGLSFFPIAKKLKPLRGF